MKINRGAGNIRAVPSWGRPISFFHFTPRMAASVGSCGPPGATGSSAEGGGFNLPTQQPAEIVEPAFDIAVSLGRSSNLATDRRRCGAERRRDRADRAAFHFAPVKSPHPRSTSTPTLAGAAQMGAFRRTQPECDAPTSDTGQQSGSLMRRLTLSPMLPHESALAGRAANARSSLHLQHSFRRNGACCVASTG